MAKTTKKEIHGLFGDPYLNLYAAMLLQAFEDYAAYCRIVQGKLKGDDLHGSPLVEQWLIRQWLREISPDTDMNRALDRYLAKRRIQDTLTDHSRRCS